MFTSVKLHDYTHLVLILVLIAGEKRYDRCPLLPMSLQGTIISSEILELMNLSILGSGERPMICILFLLQLNILKNNFQN